MPRPDSNSLAAGLTKNPVEAGDQGACPSADPSSFVPSQDGPRSSAPFAGPQLEVEAALSLAAVEVPAVAAGLSPALIQGCFKVVGQRRQATIVIQVPR
jgi:hypothetical protein